MNAASRQPKIYPAFIYGGVALVAFLCGAGFIWFMLGQQAEPSAPSADLAFVTFTPSPVSLNPVATNVVSCPPPPDGWVSYTIQPGDTLSDLAARFQISQGRIMQANCLTSPADLQAEQRLYLPPLLTPTPCSTILPPNWGLYTVQGGDTLSGLAAARGVTAEDVIRVNCLASPDLVEGQSLYLLVLPTPTPCAPSPPPNWNLYTVQSGDTLFSLATIRGVTVDQVTRVNCLSASNPITVGRQLYLPTLPTPTPIPTPTPVATLPPLALSVPDQGVSVPPPILGVDGGSASQVEPDSGQSQIAPTDSRFSPLESIPIFTVKPPNPNADFDFNKEHCKPDPSTTPTPYLDVFFNDPSGSNVIIELGQRRYFFTCNFPTGPATAIVTRSDGITESVPVQSITALPNRDLQFSQEALAFVHWSALPFHPIGTYNLTVSDSSGNPPQEQPFEVVLPTQAYILPVPPAGPPGTIFLVYYVRFDLKPQDFTLYYSGNPPIRPGIYDLDLTYQSDSWQIPITEPLAGSNNQGWGLGLLPSSQDDLQGTYVISSTNTRTHQKIWLQSGN